MVNIKDIVKSVGLEKEYWPGEEVLNIDIGDYEFTDVTHTEEFTWLFTNEENPNIKLYYGEEKSSVILYELLDYNFISKTLWRRGEIYREKIIEYWEDV